jgi:hypothetical protein
VIIGPGVQYVLDTATETMYVYGETIPDALWEACGWNENEVCLRLCVEAVTVACGFVPAPQWVVILYPEYALGGNPDA